MNNTVTLEKIQSKIKGEMYIVLPDGRTTVCMLTMKNGYTIKGMSACVDIANFDFMVGRKISREDAIRQIWPLEGYLLAEEIFARSLEPEKPTLSPQRARAMKDAGLWNNKRKRKRVATSLMEHDGKAPWGYKKDGTPKKRPGRAPKEQT
jgi:hypothetical protein